MRWLLWLHLLLRALEGSVGEVFTSMAAMEQVLSWEKKMLREVNTYVKTEEEKIAQMKEFVGKLEKSVGKVIDHESFCKIECST